MCDLHPTRTTTLSVGSGTTGLLHEGGGVIEDRGTMRRLIEAVTVALVFVMLASAPALADRPFTFTDSVTFVDVNPCTGLDDEITINVEVSIHEHRNNFVVYVGRTGSTASGYTMISGTESFVANNGVERGAFVDQWRHPDGSKFMVHGRFVFNVNQLEVLVDGFSLTCIGNG